MIAIDKQGHLWAGYAIAMTICVLTDSIPLAMILTALVGASKELYDSLHPDTHTADLMDFAFTTLGGAVGVVIYVLIGMGG